MQFVFSVIQFQPRIVSFHVVVLHGYVSPRCFLCKPEGEPQWTVARHGLAARSDQPPGFGAGITFNKTPVFFMSSVFFNVMYVSVFTCVGV